MHVHLGLLNSLIIFAGVLAWGTIWRLIAMHLSQNSWGQAMAIMY